MTTNSQLSTNELKEKKTQQKQKLSKQLEQEQNQRNGHHMEGYQWRERGEEQWGKGTGNKKHNWQAQDRQGKVKSSIGNEEAKELICTTHGHEPRWGKCWWEGGCRVEGNKREKKNGTAVIA